MSLISDYYPIGEKAGRAREEAVAGEKKQKTSLISQYYPSKRVAPVVKEKKGIVERAKETAVGIKEGFQSFGTKLKDVFQHAQPIVSEGIKSIIADNETIIQKSEQDLVQKIQLKQSQFKDSKEEERQLSLVRMAQDPNTPDARKKVIVDHLRYLRAERQIGASIAGFGASLLDVITQASETGNQAEIDRNQKLYEKTGNIKFKEQVDFWKKNKAKLEEKGIPTREISKKISKWSQETAVSNPDWVEKVTQGAGSMIGFTILSYATKSNATIPYLTESFSEAGATYEENRRQGKSIEESSVQADRNLVFNLVWNKFLNVFDIPPGQKKNVKTAVGGFLKESFQEVGQTISGNLTTGRDWVEGVFESFVVGGVLGGVTSIALPSGQEVVVTPKPGVTEDVTTIESILETDEDIDVPTIEVDIEKLGIPTTTVENQEVNRGEAGKVTTETKSFERVLSVKTNQFELMKKLAEQGNVAAQEHIESLPEGVERVDFTVSDPIIREAFKNEFDAIEYSNEQLPQIGKEFHELSTNKFYAEEKVTAEQYAKQDRGAKFEPTVVKEVEIKKIPEGKRGTISVTEKYEGAESAFATVRKDRTGAITVKLKTEAQGSGLGSKIVADLESQLQANGVRKVELSAFEEAVGFWEKQGYKSTGEKTGLNIKMTKTLEKTPVKEVKKEIKKPDKPTKKVVKEEKKVVKEKKKPTKEKVVKVPTTQLPVGEGVQRVSRLEARTKDKLGNLTEAEIDELGLATYNQVNKKENIAKASTYVANNTEEALRVIKGEIDPPKGILVNSIYVALNTLGATDTDVATKVASLGATRMGQEISILSELLKDSPVTMMEDIVKTRIEAFEKRTGKKVSDKIKSEKKKIDKDLKAPNSRQWDAFLKEIVC